MRQARLGIRNPSEVPRLGPVSMPWQPVFRRTGIEPEALVLRVEDSGQPLPAQVDLIDPADPSQATLVFLVDTPVPPGSEHYTEDSLRVVVERGVPSSSPGPRCDRKPNGFHLINDRLDVWFQSIPDREGGKWFSGSAPSVILDGMEILDNFRALMPFGHDPEKRCMQIDRIRLSRPAWEPAPFQDEILVQRGYTIVCASAGPVRASVTLASEPFSYSYLDPATRREVHLLCRLFRVISLYRGADHVMEDLYVKGEPQGGEDGSLPVSLFFTARYFAYMDMSLTPRVIRFEQIPDWLAIGCPWDPFQGYGFSTDVHTACFTCFPPEFPNAEGRHKAFSWEIGISDRARCLHLFRRSPPEILADETGRAWYSHIYKPLRAVLAE